MNGNLYFKDSNGKWNPMTTGIIEDIDLTSFVDPDSPTITTRVDNKFTLTCNAFVVNTNLMRKLLGFPVSNNWLKMHGKPMKRKKIWRHKSKRKG